MCCLSNLLVFLLLVAVSFGQNTEALPASPAANQAIRSYHDGSIRDIDAIGNRNIGCGRGLGNWYSLDKQIAMGKEYSQ